MRTMRILTVIDILQINSKIPSKIPRTDSSFAKDFSIDSNSGQENLTEIISELKPEFIKRN